MSGALKAVLFGATVAATMGPIALLIINVAAVDGIARGLRASLGAAAADLVFAVTAFAGGYAVTAVLATYHAELATAASVALLAFGAWMVVRAARLDRNDGASPRSLTAPFLQTFALTIVNPLGIAVFMSLAVQLPAAPSVAATAFLSLSVFAGSLLVQVGLALAGALFGRFGERTGGLRMLNVVSGLGVAAFGLAGLWPLLEPGVS